MSENQNNMTFGEKLRSARKSAGLTQEQLAEMLTVSRQAVAKWESDKGMPDIGNLKRMSKLLNVSIDYLLDDGEKLDFTVIREEIDLSAYDCKRKTGGRWVKKTGKKDRIVRERYPDAESRYLLGKQILTKGEKVTDNLIGFLTNAPFGIPDFLNSLKNTDKDFYLINEPDRQYFAVVTDEFIEVRQMSTRITDKKFKIGGFSFIDCGPIPEKTR